MTLVDGIHEVARCSVVLDPAPLAYAEQNRDAIAAHFAQAVARNPAYYNGRLLLATSCAICPRTRVLEARMTLSDFATFLFWREHGQPVGVLHDVFGSALVEASDGGVMLGVAASHTLNGGRTYLPGGFIDANDLRDGGLIDVDQSIARELIEETGLDAGDMTRVPGYLVTVQAAMVSIAVVLRARATRAELATTFAAHRAREARPELDRLVFVREPSELADPAIADYARGVVAHRLAATASAASSNGVPPCSHDGHC